MATDKLIPQYLNLNDDERFLQANEMKYALNVEIASDDKGNGGVLKNIEGNTLINPKSVSDTIPSSGTNTIIGACASEAGKCIYYFLYNSVGTHGIYKLDYSEGKYVKVYSSGALNFKLDSYVKADLLINQYQEHLLYFTDGVNEPMKINATKAILGTTNLAAETESDKILTYLTVCKRPPLKPITFSFRTNGEIVVNRIKDNLFQFACQYVYEDGEVSAISPYSELAVASSHLAPSITERGTLSKTDNEIELYVPTTTRAVKKIRVLARRNNEGAFYKIDEVLNNVATEAITVRFSNDGVFPVVPDQEALKPFDAVPRIAQTQVLSNNRLMYGNYVEGYDNIETSSRITPIYHEARDVDNIEFSRDDLDWELEFQDDYVAANYALFNPFTTSYTAEDETLFYQHLFPYTFNNQPIPQVPSDFTVFAEDTFTSFGGENPTGFEIDLTEIEDLPPNEELFVYCDIRIDADRLGITARNINGWTEDNPPGVHDKAFTTQITLKNGGFSGGAITKSVAVCSPAMEFIQNVANVGAVYSHPTNGLGGQINGLQVVDSTSIEEVITFNTGTASTESNLELLGNKLATDLSGKEVILFVDCKVGDGYPHRNFFKDIADDRNYLEIGFVGQVKFVTVATYNPVTKKVFVEYQMTDVDLSAKRAWVNKQLFNDFHPGGSTDPFTFSDTSTNSQVIGSVKTANATQVNGTQLLKDSVDADGNMVYHTLLNPRFNGYVNLSLSAVTKTFKSSAKHSFGVVYFDINGRVGGVQKLDDINMPSLKSAERGGNYGRSEVDLRIWHEPPAWATKWAPVYTKNLTYDYYLQTTVAEALVPDKNSYKNILSPAVTADDESDSLEAIDSTPGANLRSSIFVSMRTLEGKDNSYKEFKGGQIDYQYQEGDVLRVLSYRDGSNTEQKTDIEFQITGYKFFNNDKANPLKLPVSCTEDDVDNVKAANNYRRTGWFLQLRDSDVAGFSRTDILKGEDFWSQACLVEIVRQKKDVENELYFEVGKVYDVITAPANKGGARTHAGDRGIDLGIVTIDPIGDYRFTSTTRFYVGDKIAISTAVVPTGSFIVAKVIPRGEGFYEYIMLSPVGFAQSYLDGNADEDAVVSCSVAEPSVANPIDPSTTYAGVVTLNCGDAYLRPREMMINKRETYSPTLTGQSFAYNPLKVDDYDYDKFTVEDSSASDFFYSKAVDTGRPHVETPEQKRVRRFHSVTYSEAYSPDSSRLMLSTFDPNAYPFKDYPSEGGHIYYLFDQNDSVILFQEKKVTITPVNRQLIQSMNGGQLVASQDVLGTASYLAGDFGISRNPQSFAERGGRMFFSDVESAKIFEISGKGIEPISDTKMESHFDKTFSNAMKLKSRPKLVGGIDPDNNEYISTIHQIDIEDIYLGATFIGSVPDGPSGAILPDGQVDVVFSNENGLTWDTDCLHYNADFLTYHPKWNEVGQGTMFLNQLQESGGVFINEEFEGETGQYVIDTLVTINAAKHRGTAKISLSDNTIDIGDAMLACADGSQLALTISANDTAERESTVGYLYDKKVWQSFYSFIPELYANLFNDMYSFKSGNIYKHKSNSTHCNFYGTQYGFEVQVISKQNPSMVKVYDTLSLEGSLITPSVQFDNSYQTSKYTGPSDHPWDVKEQMYYLPVPKANSESIDYTDRHAVHLGKVASIDGATITFDAPINKRPVLDSNILIVYSGGAWVPLDNVAAGRTGKYSITCVGDISSISVGDDLLMGAPTFVNGDDIRDYYVKTTMTWGANYTAPTVSNELYAVNLNFTPSPLHEETVQQQQ